MYFKLQNIRKQKRKVQRNKDNKYGSAIIMIPSLTHIGERQEIEEV